jgi:hypothetical protein
MHVPSTDSNQHRNPKPHENTAKSHVTQEAPTPISVWVEHAERLKRRLNKITNGSLKSFANDACQRYMLTLNSDALDGHIHQLNDLQKAITRCHDEILQLAGVGPELAKIGKLADEVRMLIWWIDEILCTILEGNQNLTVFKMYLEHKYTFQSA